MVTVRFLPWKGKVNFDRTQVMGSTRAQLLFHIVFSTKDRRPLITPELKGELYKYIGGIIRGEGGSLIEIGGVRDHVPLVVHLKANMSVADIRYLCSL